MILQYISGSSLHELGDYTGHYDKGEYCHEYKFGMGDRLLSYGLLLSPLWVERLGGRPFVIGSPIADFSG